MSCEQTILHGTFMNIFGIGTQIMGESGIGKSELGLALIDRKHQLIADDAPIFSRNKQQIVGKAQEPFKGFMNIQGIGVINIITLFGNQALKDHRPLTIIINLKKISNLPKDESTYLSGIYTNKKIFDVTIPEITIPIMNGRNLAIITEIIVKNFIAKRNHDYDAAKEFENLQKKQIGQAHS
jgi:HPr kinase/phosphorylase